MSLSGKKRNAWVGVGPINIVRALGLTFSFCLLSLAVFAQGNAGRILGAVTDQTGSAIIGSAVTVTDLQRGITRNLVTDDAGQYFAPNLLPGMYKVRAEA